MNIPQISNYYPFYSIYKIDPNLLNSENQEEKIKIIFKEKINFNKLNQITTNYEIINQNKNILILNIDPDFLIKISEINSIEYIEKYSEFKVLNNVARNITNSNYIWDNLGFYGEGQIVSIADTGLDLGVNDATMHDDFEGRIVDIIDFSGDGSNDEIHGHGTHVAGSVLGSGVKSGANISIHNYSDSYAGIAPEASLYFQATQTSNGDLLMPINLTDLFLPAYQRTSRIHSNSWGGGVHGEYTDDSKQVDTFVFNHTDFVILFAIGNDGNDSNSDGIIDLNSSFAPATSKNVISVGASENLKSNSWVWSSSSNPINGSPISDNSFGIAEFSSRGPTNDGRIKPDLVAPGTYILSTRSQDPSFSFEVGSEVFSNYSNQYYQYMQGTSMSTPIVAGNVALLKEYFEKRLNYSYPSAALVKGLLINGAKDLSPGQYETGIYQEVLQRPDYSQGWGRVDLKNSINPNNSKIIFYLENKTGFTTGDDFLYSFNITKNISNIPLRVTLIYSDYPSTTLAATNLVNDLDLTLTLPNSTQLKGNYMLYGNSNYDRINNIEGIDLNNVALGEYTINVSGYNIPSGPQPFSIIVSYEENNSIFYTENSNIENNNITTNYAILNFTLDKESQVELLLNNVSQGFLTSSDNLNFEYNTGNLNNGEYSIELIIIPYKNNFDIVNPLYFSNSKILNFNISFDNLTKLIDISPLNNSILNKTNLIQNFNLSFTKNLTRLIAYYNNSIYNLTSNIQYNSANFNISFADYKENQIIFEFEGGEQITNNITYNVYLNDFRSPSINSINPLNNSIFNSTNINYSVNFNISFNKNISKLDLYSMGNLYNIFNSSTLNQVQFRINLSKYKYNNFTFILEDQFNLTSNFSYNLYLRDNSTPQISYINILNNLVINLSNLNLPIFMNFTKKIINFSYIYNNQNFDLTSQIINNSINSSIDLINYSQNIISFEFEDEFQIKKNYTLQFNSSLYLNSSLNDTDGDGINDSIDNLIGNIENINSNLNLSFYVNQSNNLSQIFNSTLNITFKEDNLSLIEFENNFSINPIDLTKMTIKKEVYENKTRMYISGLDLETSKTKIIYLNLTNSSKFQSLCIADKTINNFNDISNDCSQLNETYIHQIPFSNSYYTINFVNSSSSFIKITGLKHSGITQTCMESWTAVSWSGTCNSGTETGTTTDLNNCGTTFEKPATSKTCTIEDPVADTADTGEYHVDTGDTKKSTTIQTISQTPTISNDIIVPKYEKLISNIYIDGKNNLTSKFNSIETVKIKDSSKKIDLISFDFDFSKSDLNLSSLYYEYNEEKSYLIVNGINLELGKTKILKIKSNLNSNKICIKDAEISKIEEVSSTCNKTDEYIIFCDSKITSQGYSCNFKDGYYTIFGLKHSTVLEYKNNESENLKSLTNNLTPQTNFKITSITKKESNETIPSLNNEENSNSNILLISVIILSIIILVVFILIYISKNQRGYSYKKKENNVTELNNKLDNIITSNDGEFEEIKKYIDSNINEFDLELLGSNLINNGYNSKKVTQYLKEFRK